MPAHDETDDKATDRGMQEEHEEEFMIVKADAVADPGAMMVHSQDAPAAGRTMVRSGRLQGTAPHAITPLDQIQCLKWEAVKYAILNFVPFTLRQVVNALFHRSEIVQINCLCY
eukprot:CAMPEP_0185588370 /NCGR_PEP_ID=MMETSP0434-20130131/52799_1 /TAXON_ID=626734 ORGANISM="Favella taraikaensis, Strain Fe Narragansett Bay" /NCGR_SAMPLE_ID=MMETSP0434 /ASSEMBLY_ACC=CAM_ASM_000379 /LENGTH=113 /DNA_ID=CAMNT_0028210973 /DNA_START=304 /DNA_END=645 /DNA_ORIENTATION=-